MVDKSILLALATRPVCATTTTVLYPNPKVSSKALLARFKTLAFCSSSSDDDSSSEREECITENLFFVVLSLWDDEVFVDMDVRVSVEYDNAGGDDNDGVEGGEG